MVVKCEFFLHFSEASAQERGVQCLYGPRGGETQQILDEIIKCFIIHLKCLSGG